MSDQNKCITPGCNEPADGLDNEHCQQCWEMECDAEFNNWIKAADAAGLLRELDDMTENTSPVDAITDIPRLIAICPECGGTLEAEITTRVTATNRPTSGGVLVRCSNEDEGVYHSYLQSDWAMTNDTVEKYLGVDDQCP